MGSSHVYAVVTWQFYRKFYGTIDACADRLSFHLQEGAWGRGYSHTQVAKDLVDKCMKLMDHL